MKKNILMLAAALSAAMILSATAQEGAPAAEGGAPAAPQGPKPSMFLVGVAKAGSVDHNPVRTFAGRVLSPETVAIVPQVAGEVEKVAFREGDTVKKGKLLYVIDDVQYKAAEAAAEAAVAQAEASLDYARKTFDRTKTLFEKNAASVDAMDNASSALAVAQANLASAKANLERASDSLAHCRITAPVDGKIGVNAASVGNYVSTASGALATIVRQDPVRVAFAPGSRDYLAVFGGEKGLKDLFEVRLRLADGTAFDAEGEVEFVGNEVNAATDTMPVYARFANPDGLLVPGATVKVEVRAKAPARHVAVPLTAVQRDGEQAFVWMVGENNLPVRRDIEAGPATASYQTVLSGLEEGESVIVRGTHKVIPGVPVEPVEL
jgi:RND family efflux transporter MFP subunit